MKLNRRYAPHASVRSDWHTRCPTGSGRQPGIRTPKAACISRPEDLARIGYLYLRDGLWDGRRVLPAGWAARATTRYVTGRGAGVGLWLSVVVDPVAGTSKSGPAVDSAVSY